MEPVPAAPAGLYIRRAPKDTSALLLEGVQIQGGVSTSRHRNNVTLRHAYFAEKSTCLRILAELGQTDTAPTTVMTPDGRVLVRLAAEQFQAPSGVESPTGAATSPVMPDDRRRRRQRRD